MSRSIAAGATIAGLEGHLLLAASDNAQAKASSLSPAAVADSAEIPKGKLGSLTLSRLIGGGNLINGWCHQRDLLFVRRLAEAYLTEAKQFDTLALMESQGINSITVDMMQMDLLRKYQRQRGGKIKTIVAVRQDWGDWSRGNWDNLKQQINIAMAAGPDSVFLHGGYCDRMVQSGTPRNIEILNQGLEYIRQQGLTAGLGSHDLQVPIACSQAGVEPDYYVKTFHHDHYWSAIPKAKRQPFSVDGPRSSDHNEFHDNIFCLDAEGTAEFMRSKKQPWIAFKVLAAGAIPPKSGFQYAFENGADFITVGMFDFEVAEDVKVVKEVLKNVQRQRPWASATT